jgi:sec-independent protein translocase protein TatB
VLVPGAVSGSLQGGVILGIGLGEFILILLVAFIIVGPEDLPKVARTLARWVKTCKQSMQEIKSSLDLDAEKKSLDAVGQEVSNSVRGANSELERVQKQVLESAKRQQA